MQTALAESNAKIEVLQKYECTLAAESIIEANEQIAETKVNIPYQPPLQYNPLMAKLENKVQLARPQRAPSALNMDLKDGPVLHSLQGYLTAS